jgi:hypothetical protein
VISCCRHRCERVGGLIKLIADGLLPPGDGYDYLRVTGKKIRFDRAE